MAVLGIGALILVYGYGPLACTWSINFTSLVFETLINLPLREIYRYGPSVIGWEGASLPAICARITYHGDEAFWARNLVECQRIFSLKEEAWLRFTRPLVYCGGAILAIQVVRMLVREHALQRRQPLDRDMVETYQAFQIMMRQLKRSLHHK